MTRVSAQGLAHIRAFSMNIPLHDKTPRVILAGRHIIVEEHNDGWHIGLTADGFYKVLFILGYGDQHLMRMHVRAFGNHFDAMPPRPYQ